MYYVSLPLSLKITQLLIAFTQAAGSGIPEIKTIMSGKITTIGL